MAAITEPLKVLFIGAVPRSGSTLLDRMLGCLPGFFSAGELRRIWDRGLERNHLCGCGLPLKSCPFWSQVLNSAFGNQEQFNLSSVQETKRYLERTRNLYRYLLYIERGGRYGIHLAQYTKTMQQLYNAIAEVAGNRVIIDSSKTPMHGFILNCIPNLRVYFIHLVRDSRAVAFSMLRKKEMPIGLGSTVRMVKKGAVASAIDWNLMNTLLRLMRIPSERRLLIRYEDLASEPGKTMQRICKLIDEPLQHEELIQNGNVEFHVSHTVSGNPMRFTTGSTQIKQDSEWRTSSQAKRNIVTAMTWPLLLAFGYPVLNVRTSLPHES